MDIVNRSPAADDNGGRRAKQAEGIPVKGRRRTAVEVGAIAGVLGGSCWAVKAAAIMLTGVQPPIIFEVAPLFFPIAVVGLSALVDPPWPKLARAGVALACCAEAAALASVLGLFLGPPGWTPQATTVTVLTPFIAFAALATFVSLFLIGVMVRRTPALLAGWANLPVLLALSAIPLIAVSGLLEDIHKRLFEAPTLLLGLGWITLGAVMRYRPATAAALRGGAGV